MSFAERLEGTNLFMLRIGRCRTMPLRLYVHKTKFTDLMFQVRRQLFLTEIEELLATLRDLLPQHLHIDPLTGFFTTRFVAEKKPCYEIGSEFQFIFYFAETSPKFSLLVPGQQIGRLQPNRLSTHKTEIMSEEESEDSDVSLETFLRREQTKSHEPAETPSQPAPVNGLVFSDIEVTRHTLIVEVFSKNVAIPDISKKKETVDPQQQHAISRYFSSQALPKNDKQIQQRGKNKSAEKRKRDEK